MGYVVSLHGHGSHSRKHPKPEVCTYISGGKYMLMELWRNLFDRVLAIKMTSHKAKSVLTITCRCSKLTIFFRSFFKKWLDLERRIGDEDGAEAVKQKAIEWTQRASNAS